MYTALILPLVAAIVNDSDEVCDHVQFGEQDRFFLLFPHPNTSVGYIHAGLDRLKCIVVIHFLHAIASPRQESRHCLMKPVSNDLCQWKVSTRRRGMFIMRIRRERKHEV